MTLKKALSTAVCLALLLGEPAIAQTSTSRQWWQEVAGTTATQSETLTLSGTSSTSNARGTSVTLNGQVTSQQPVAVVKDTKTGPLAVAKPSAVNFGIVVTGPASVTRTSVANYTVQVSNYGTSARVARFGLVARSSYNSSVPATAGALGCGAVPNCTVMSDGTIRVTIGAGSTVVFTRSYTMSAASTGWVQVTGFVYSSDGLSDTTTSNNFSAATTNLT